MLLTHGARSVLRAAAVARNAAKPLDALRTWALAVQGRTNHNKAACALANKMARICYATLRDAQPYGQPRTNTRERRSLAPSFADRRHERATMNAPLLWLIKYFRPTSACLEIDRPSWQNRVAPQPQ